MAVISVIETLCQRETQERCVQHAPILHVFKSLAAGIHLTIMYKSATSESGDALIFYYSSFCNFFWFPFFLLRLCNTSSVTFGTFIFYIYAYIIVRFKQFFYGHLGNHRI